MQKNHLNLYTTLVGKCHQEPNATKIKPKNGKKIENLCSGKMYKMIRPIRWYTQCSTLGYEMNTEKNELVLTVSNLCILVLSEIEKISRYQPFEWHSQWTQNKHRTWTLIFYFPCVHWFARFQICIFVFSLRIRDHWNYVEELFLV